MISVLRINYHIHRAMEFFGLFMGLVCVIYMYLFAVVGRDLLVAASLANLVAVILWSIRMSTHAIKAKNAFNQKLVEYERIYGKLT